MIFIRLISPTDLLNELHGDTKTLLEALGDYYHTHNMSFKDLNLSKESEEKLNAYKDDAIRY